MFGKRHKTIVRRFDQQDAAHSALMAQVAALHEANGKLRAEMRDINKRLSFNARPRP